jgi:uncharacterized protein involved in exopolysaccharide biosynthesis
VYANTQKSIYRSQGQLLFKQEDKSSFLVGLESSQQQGNQQGGRWLDADRILDTEIRVLLSDPILQQTLDVLKRKNFQGLPSDIEEFRANLAIKNAAGTNVLEVSYQDTDPKVAAAIINQLMKTYLNGT